MDGVFQNVICDDMFVYAIIYDGDIISICQNVESCAIHAHLMGYSDKAFSIRQFPLLNYRGMTFDKIISPFNPSDNKNLFENENQE